MKKRFFAFFLFILASSICLCCWKKWSVDKTIKIAEDEQFDYRMLAEEENMRVEMLLRENYEAVNPPQIIVEDEPEQEINSAIQQKAVSIDIERLRDFSTLCKSFYQIDRTTEVKRELLDLDTLINMDMSINEGVDGPQILIYHTHSQECYCDSVVGDDNTSVMGVGDYLKELLEEKGFNVMHHCGKYDVEDRDHAYSRAEPEIKKILEENKSIQMVIDLHRDGVAEGTRLVTDIEGRKTAQIMFFNGLSRTKKMGDIEYLKNPYIQTDLALSFQLQFASAEYFPGLARRIYLKGYRYNMHLCPKSVLVEVGAQTNTFEEAKNAMIPLAELVEKVIRK